MSHRLLSVALIATILIAAGSPSTAAKSHQGKTVGGARQRRSPEIPIAGRIAYIGEGGNLYVCDAACRKPLCVTCTSKAEQARGGAIVPAALASDPPAPVQPISYDLPTFSPDATQIAYASAQRRGGSLNFAINVYNFTRRVPITVFQSSEHPIYFYWLPGGQRIFFLAENGDSLDLILAEVREGRPVRALLKGLPIFFDWNQALNDLAFHYAPPEDSGPEQAGLIQITARDQHVVKVFSSGAASFRSPVWSPDRSHLAYVLNDHRGQFDLMVADADGNEAKPMVGLAPGTTAFEWAADSRHIAFSTLKREGRMSYDGINLLDLETGNISTLVSAPVIAYFFSPDGKWLAYIGTGENANTWNVIAAGGGRPRKLCDFIASSSESTVYRVFDQYALSHRIWSPDSRAIVFAGAVLQQDQAPPENISPSVWAVPIDGQAPRTIADGSVGFWSPR